MSNNISEKDRLIQLLDKKQKSIYGFGNIEKTPSSSDWYTEAFKKVNALIMIGGKGGTLKAFEEAEKNLFRLYLFREQKVMPEMLTVK